MIKNLEKKLKNTVNKACIHYSTVLEYSHDRNDMRGC